MIRKSGDVIQSIGPAHQHHTKKHLALLFTPTISDGATIRCTVSIQFCGTHGLKVPLDVSLICTDPSPTFAWCRPTVAHIHWDPAPALRRVLRWSKNVARGKQDRRQTVTKADFVAGGTIGPAPNKIVSK